MQAGLKGSDLAKFLAGQRASLLVENGMSVGLGTGSTAHWLVKCLGERVRQEGLKFTAVATSNRTFDQAKSEGIDIRPFDGIARLDIAIDGADEIDPDFNLIKGAGGALLQEKIVASAADRMVVVADPSKLVQRLGAFPLPIEVVNFGMAATERLLGELLDRVDVRGKGIALRMNRDKPCETDCGNRILDLSLKTIANPRQLAAALPQIPGVIESGLFIGLCDTVVIGYEDGRTSLRERGAIDGNLFDEEAR